MSKKYKKRNVKQRVERYFIISKVFHALTPVVGYLYISLRASMLSITFQEVLQTMPSVSVIFLVAMVNAYIAYVLHLVQQKLKQGEIMYVCTNMLLLIIAQLLVGNFLFVAMLAWLFYVVVKTYQIKVLQVLKQSTLKKTVVYSGGSIIVLVLSSISLFATLRLM